MGQRDPALATKYLKKYLDYNSSDCFANFQLGYTYLIQGNLKVQSKEEAKQEFFQAALCLEKCYQGDPLM